jgi:hypothetical protein
MIETIDYAEKFQEILLKFNFTEVIKVREILNWETLSEEELQEECCSLFDDIYSARANGEKVTSVSSGGFEVAMFDDGFLQLKFVPYVVEYDPGLNEISE